MYNLNALEFASIDFAGVVAGDAPGEFHAIHIANANDLSAFEPAFATGDAGRQQTFPAFAQSPLGAVVHEQRAFGVMKEGNPAFATFKPRGPRHKKGALDFAS